MARISCSVACSMLHRACRGWAWGWGAGLRMADVAPRSCQANPLTPCAPGPLFSLVHYLPHVCLQGLVGQLIMDEGVADGNNNSPFDNSPLAFLTRLVEVVAEQQEVTWLQFLGRFSLQQLAAPAVLCCIELPGFI